jgi:hypothetical protein
MRTIPTFSALVPVVERPPDVTSAGEWVGSLRRIVLTPLGAARGGTDEIHLDVALFGTEASQEQALRQPVAAARRLIGTGQPKKRIPFLRAQISLEGETTMLQGSSANLALAALLYCAALDGATERDTYRVETSSVITGALDENGRVLPVDAASIPAKTAATFFSAAATMVVPREQQAIFEENLSLLQKKYPHRVLTLLGIERIEELFFDRRITLHRRFSLPHQMVRKTWKWRRSVAALLIVGLVLAVAKLLYGPIDRVPVDYKLSGEDLIIMNRGKEMLEKIPVGARTVENFRTTPATLADHLPCAIADVDDNRSQDIIWIELAEWGSLYGTVLCKEFGSDIPRWSYKLQRDLSFPLLAETMNRDFVPSDVIVDDFDGNGTSEVLVVYRHESFPGVVQMLDAISGREIGHYLHTGQFADVQTIDLDGDGVKEIILAGVNNAFRQACLVVLDPRDLNGRSPSTEEYRPDGYERANEKEYALIPYTVVGMAYRHLSKYNMCVKFNHSTDSRILTVQVIDVQVTSGRGDCVLPTATIWLRFGYDLRFQSLFTGDDFDTLFYDLIGEGRIPDITRREALMDFGNGIRYLEAERWVER